LEEDLPEVFEPRAALLLDTVLAMDVLEECGVS
jgi:hypothetical protein